MFQSVVEAYLKRIIALTLVFMVVGTLARAFFLALYTPPGLSEFSSDVLKAFILGARFDLTVQAYIYSIPLLLLLLISGVDLIFPLITESTRKILDGFFTVYFGLMLFIVVTTTAFDTFYYSFYQDRLNILIFGLFEDDTEAILKTIWKNYPVITFALLLSGFAIVISWLLIRLKKQFPLTSPVRWKLKAWILPPLLLGIFVLNGVIARGSLGLFPLSEMDTHISRSIFVNILSYNSIHALSRAIQNKRALKGDWNANLKNFGYGDDPQRALSEFFGKTIEELPQDMAPLIAQKTPKNAWAESKKPHVILLVMESFGAYWAQLDQPEFDLLGDLKKHFAEDFVTFKMLSGTGSTVGSLSSLIAGVPQKTTSEFLPEGPYLSTPFRTAPAYNFKKAGYKTRFIYGGNPGWRDMNKYAKVQYFESIEGESEIVKDLAPREIERHDWGVYDEDVWDYLFQSLEKAKEPQFVLTMTTTNHPPYELPSTYQVPELEIPDHLRDRLMGDKDVALQRFKAFRYSNQKLSEFVDRIKNSSLKDRVVLAVTGDHTFWLINFTETQYMERGAVPFYIYSGRGPLKSKDPIVFASHADILPTLYEEALSEKTFYSFNQGIFNPHRKNLALAAAPFVVGDLGAVMLVPGDTTRRNYFLWDSDFKELRVTEPVPELDPMANYYQSLMGTLDYFFYSEKQRARESN